MKATAKRLKKAVPTDMAFFKWAEKGT